MKRLIRLLRSYLKFVTTIKSKKLNKLDRGKNSRIDFFTEKALDFKEKKQMPHLPYQRKKMRPKSVVLIPFALKYFT